MTVHDETHLTARLDALSVEQKVRLLTGADFWALHPEPAIGLRRVVTSDGPAGVRGERWDEREPSANVPSPTALAATWDEARLERIGRLLAGEARRKGVDVLLAPTVNLHRTPYGGRHFEHLSEDPLLTARIGAAYVRGLQAGGVGATVKHYVANDSETDRFTLDAVLDERTLRELYLAPFETIVREAGAWAVMVAYNSVNGTTMTESALQRDVLKAEWGFDGVVMSDWYAARSLAAAGPGLLDLVMPGPVGPWGDALVDAVRAGAVPETALDDKVLRILRLAARVGALEGIAPAAPAAEPLTDAELSAELRSAAAAGFVLARNSGPLLPLDRAGPNRVAVLGPNAAAARTLGGGSATVFPPYAVAPLDGLRAALAGAAEVAHATGCRAGDRVPVAPLDLLVLPDGSGAGLEARFVAADGTLLGRERRRSATLTWLGTVLDGVPVRDVAAVELHARLRAAEAGRHLIGASGLGAFRLAVEGRTLVETTLALPPGSDVVEGMMRPPQAHAAVELAAGQEVALVLRHEPLAAADAFGGADVATLMLQLNAGLDVDDEAELERAIAIAADSDVAVVVVGTTEEVESEGFDRTSLDLPGRQDELVRRVAAVNRRTVVVVNAGAPVLLPWADEVAAVLLAWFPGQEFGNALADVLLGAAEPGGRLPTTWPLADTAHPPVTPAGGRLVYDEGLFVGYRAYQRDGRAPRYPFGHGLGYAEWDYEALSAPASAEPGRDVTVTVELRNSGRHGGREVVQVYASRPGSSIERPARWLAGFAVVEAGAGEPARVEVALAARAFQHWDASAGWSVERGMFRVAAGRSAADLRVSGEVAIG
ncbi:MAG TPA: glycoside hydrolase family 3 C-terminal domain-containing protein [Solirubrobacteraceae bacterium]|nr:glycoside hydrolase family 3 C-terminal domain-containing protein [Solirubrobacteraceae bacterium]